jgi:diacylglycerol kinase (ATP)
MKHALVIFNPMAGAKSWKNVTRIIQDELTKQGFSWEWFETKPVKRQPLAAFKKGEFDRIIVVGGDGTVTEVASLLIKNKIKTPLVIVPQGSGNLLATTLKIPLLQVRKAVQFGLTKPSKPLDIMKINGRHHGLIAVGQGYDVHVMKHTTRHLKRQLGIAAYALTFLKTFFIYHAQPYRLTIDGKRHHVLAKSILVFNAFPFPQIELGTSIQPDDGKLNVVVFNPRSLWDLLRHAPKFQTFTGKNIVIKPKKDTEFDVDGDILKGKTLRIEIKPKALNLVRP